MSSGDPPQIGGVNFEHNEQLFGFDPLTHIVAVEFSEPNIAEVFVRNGDGTTEIRRETFSPYLWNAQQGEPLNGDLPMNRLWKVSDWLSYQDARGQLQKAGQPFFAFNDPIQQYLTLSGRTLFKGMQFEDLRRMQIGIALTDEGTLSAVALCDSSGWHELREVESIDGERQALEWLTSAIRERDPDVIEGHHLFKIGLPAVSARAKKLKVKLAWGRGGEALKSRPSRLQIAEKTIQYPKFSVRGRHLVDTWMLAQYYDVSSRELESFELRHVAEHFGVPDDVEGVLRDVRETRSLASVLSRSYFTQARVFPYNYQDVIIRGNATKIDALFLREYLRRGSSLPDFPEPRTFEGGYTDIFATGVIEDVWHCDATSLYPSVILAFGYLPRNDVLGVFGGMLRDLRAFRLEAKAAMNAAKDARERSQFDALQSTFKILINSYYGYLGFAQGHFADFDAAEKVTAKGREILRQMVDCLTRSGARVIEIDTDGIYFHPPENAEIGALQRALAAELPSGIEVEFDKRYRAMFSYKAKNYALLEEDGGLVLKGGALKSRGMEPFLRNYLESFLTLILEGEPAKAGALREELTEKIRRRELPIETLAKTEALQDSLASYQRKIGASSRNRSAAFELAIKSGRNYQAGDQVSYYVTGTKKKVVAYENARLVSDWNPDERDENVEYYVGKLDELAKKFTEFASAPSKQDDLFG